MLLKQLSGLGLGCRQVSPLRLSCAVIQVRFNCVVVGGFLPEQGVEALFCFSEVPAITVQLNVFFKSLDCVSGNCAFPVQGVDVVSGFSNVLTVAVQLKVPLEALNRVCRSGLLPVQGLDVVSGFSNVPAVAVQLKVPLEALNRVCGGGLSPAVLIVPCFRLARVTPARPCPDVGFVTGRFVLISPLKKSSGKA